MLELIEDIALAAVPAIMAITLHEAAHGYAAWALGDDTARRLGRLSLNPLRHIDRFGTLILPGLLVLGLFNLLPIPPLDGGRIAVGLLPARLAAGWARLERAGIVIVLLLVFLGPRLLAEFGIAFDPMREALQAVLPRAFHLVYRLAFIGG